MRGASRSVLVVLLAMVLLLGVMPASASGLTVTWVRNWGFKGAAPYADGSFNGPSDVAADKWGNVYVAGGSSGDDRVQMFDSDGTFIKKYDNPGDAAQQLDAPKTIATDRWGNIFVGQWDNARIEAFNPELFSHLQTIDTPAEPPNNVAGIAVALDGRLYDVVGWVKLQRRNWWGDIIAPSLWPSQPWGVGFSQDGEFYVTCLAPTNMITVNHADGTPKTAWGGTGTDPGKYDNPSDVAVDGAGNVFTVERTNDRGQAVTPSGTPLAVFGSFGSGDQNLFEPYGVGVGFDRTVYIADTNHHRISKWKVSTPTTVTNVAGANRYSTAVEASKKAYPRGAEVVVLATGMNWPDALGGSALAGAVQGPLLLTRKDALPGEVAAEIGRLKPKSVYVLGSAAAVSDAVMNAAKALTSTHTATRLGGANRYETAILIANEVKATLGDRYEGSAFVCTGENFPDALAVSPIAAANGWPIYLTPKDYLRADVRASMLDTHWGGNPSNHGYIIGSTAAVGAAVETALNTPPFMGYSRHGGINRYDTAAKVADLAFDGMGMVFSRPAIATGQNFPDALAGGVLQGSDYTVLLLTRGDTLSGEAAALLTKYKDHIYDIRFLGGPTTITNATRNAARALLW